MHKIYFTKKSMHEFSCIHISVLASFEAGGYRAVGNKKVSNLPPLMFGYQGEGV